MERSRRRSSELYEKALTYFPGGVNSPVRAFKSVNGKPIFIERGEGAQIWDADGNEYMDFCCSWGPLILGHAHPAVLERIKDVMGRGTSFGAPTQLENELAALILENNSFVNKIRFVNSGTEAVMSAIRLARGYTGKSKVIKFEGCYHGHVDHLLVKAGSGLATSGISSSAGVPEAFVRETIVLPLNDREAIEKAFEQYPDDIACVIIEPVPANNGLLLQSREYLHFLRDICSRSRSLLIFDEVISGFRLGFEGAAGYYDIQPDIITYGKIIGGGMPVGAYGASDEVMAYIAPDGPVYQAGTLSGNPVAMAAGLAQLRECLKEGFYQQLDDKCSRFSEQLNNHLLSHGLPARVFHTGSIFWISFSDKKSVSSADEIDHDKMSLFKAFYDEALSDGIYLGPSGYEVGFISAAHTDEDLERAGRIMANAFDNIFQNVKVH